MEQFKSNYALGVVMNMLTVTGGRYQLLITPAYSEQHSLTPVSVYSSGILLGETKIGFLGPKLCVLNVVVPWTNM